MLIGRLRPTNSPSCLLLHVDSKHGDDLLELTDLGSEVLALLEELVVRGSRNPFVFLQLLLLLLPGLVLVLLKGRMRGGSP